MYSTGMATPSLKRKLVLPDKTTSVAASAMCRKYRSHRAHSSPLSDKVRRSLLMKIKASTSTDDEA